jgi:HlyD family secretion protein
MRSWLIALAVVLAACGREEAERKPAPQVEVRLAEARTADLTATVEAPGALFPLAQAAVAAKISAPIRELLVTKGSAVKRDQVLAVLERLSAGALPGDLERAQTELSTAQSAVDTAEKIFERRKTLVDEGAIPVRELLVSQNELAAARNRFLLARKNLELLQSQIRERDLEIARSRVEQARARLAQAEAQLAFTRLRSPLDGMVSDQWMYPGDMAKPDAPIVTVMDLHKLVVRAQAPEARAGGLALGQSAAFVPQDQPGRKFTGRVSVISPAVDRAARTVEVWVEIDNAQRALRAGGYGTLTIAARRVPGAVAVPRSAVVLKEGADEGAVMVVDEKNIAHQRKVKVGVRQNDLIQILEGVKPGEKVVAEGNYGLPDKAEVKPK